MLTPALVDQPFGRTSPPVLWMVEIPTDGHWESLIEYAAACHAVEFGRYLRGYGYRARVRPQIVAVRHAR